MKVYMFYLWGSEVFAFFKSFYVVATSPRSYRIQRVILLFENYLRTKQTYANVF